MVARYPAPKPPELDREDVLVVSVRRGRDRYLFLFTPPGAYQAICRAHRWAADRRLNFTPQDADEIVEAIYQQVAPWWDHGVTG